jgi:hypothetical protein
MLTSVYRCLLPLRSADALTRIDDRIMAYGFTRPAMSFILFSISSRDDVVQFCPALVAPCSHIKHAKSMLGGIRKQDKGHGPV